MGIREVSKPNNCETKHASSPYYHGECRCYRGTNIPLHSLSHFHPSVTLREQSDSYMRLAGFFRSPFQELTLVNKKKRMSWKRCVNVNAEYTPTLGQLLGVLISYNFVKTDAPLKQAYRVRIGFIFARSALGRGSGGGLALHMESIRQAISYLGNFL